MARGNEWGTFGAMRRVPVTLPKARRAYELKAQGARWEWIASQTGYSTANGGRAARVMAKRYAERKGLPWPISHRGVAWKSR